MDVIYKGNSKRLIKNHKYKIDRLYNDGTNKNWLEGKLEIENLGIFQVNTFTDLSGNILPKINYGRPKELQKIIEFSDLKKGDILICKVKDLKSLLYDRMYVIEELKTEYKNYTYTTGILNKKSLTKKIKNDYVIFKGINRKIIYSPWKFEKLKSDIQREISLQSILNNQDADIITHIPKRKIEMCDNKEKELLELIAKSILDKSRHHYTIMDWVYKQLGVNLGVNEQDYEQILNMKLNDVINLLN